MERGYSLLEMLVVLAIIGLIAIVAIPPIGASIDHMRLADDTRILASALRDVREQALNQQRDVTLSVGTPSSIQSSTGDRWTFSEGSILTFAAPSGARQSFSFQQDGTATGGAFRIARGKAQANVIVDDVTGVVEISK